MVKKLTAAALATLISFSATNAYAQRGSPWTAGPTMPAFAWEIEGTAEQGAQISYATIQHNAKRERDCIKGGCLVITNPNRHWEVTQWELDVRVPGIDQPSKWVKQFSGDQRLGGRGRLMIPARGVDGTTMCEVPAIFTMENRRTDEDSMFFVTLNFCGIPAGAYREVMLPLKAEGGKVILEDGQAQDAQASSTAPEKP